MQAGRVGSDSRFPPGIPVIPNPSLHDSSSSRHPKHAPVSIWDGIFHRFLGEFQRFNPKSIWGQFGFILVSHPLFPWASSWIPDESKGQNSRPYSSDKNSLGNLGNFLGEIINIYNLEIYILKKKKGGGKFRKSQIYFLRNRWSQEFLRDHPPRIRVTKPLPFPTFPGISIFRDLT